ncbi:S-layer homology domain-containing protein [Pseudoflavonifractor capillosus]|uniref:S-layer homology domain-containing protein n=1 Tax=Pseudoflavonifractor capillosus TaxID=106588 RepID=A0A921STH3_9FIRM|nr:S-layer homology domain-containing protein [Pseudoflavonifractor capillosus]HJG87219.1 S-layer homology domain-containing protein [Pseudoflavonifractor capillosus]
MRMRKFLAAALAAVMLIGMLPAATAAVTNPPANTEGGVTLGKQASELAGSDTTITLDVVANTNENPIAIQFVLDATQSLFLSEDNKTYVENWADALKFMADKNIYAGLTIFTTTARTVMEPQLLTGDSQNDLANVENDCAAFVLASDHGTNVQAGIREGLNALSGLSTDTVAADKRYLVLITDGGSFYWLDDSGNAVNNSYYKADGTTAPMANNDAAEGGYQSLTSLNNLLAQDLSAAPQTYGSASANEPLAAAVQAVKDDADALTNFETGVYFAAKELDKVADAGVKLVTVGYPYYQDDAGVTALSQLAAEFIDYAQSKSVENGGFDATLDNTASQLDDIISVMYGQSANVAVPAGSVITDVLGYSSDENYNFDLATYEAIRVSLTNANGTDQGGLYWESQTMGDKDSLVFHTEDGREFLTLNYTEASDGTEHFTLTLHQDLLRGQKLSITYTARLVSHSGILGTHTTYPNVEAYLTPDGTESKLYFPRPSVTYTLSDGGDGGTDIEDPDVPLGPGPDLNTTDHFAYIIGRDDGLVHPMASITRAEVATIFFRMLTDESRTMFWSTDSVYVDTDSSDWFNNASATLTNAGIITGKPGGLFDPDAPITRAEFATIAVRFFGGTYEGEDIFPDIAGHWANQYINRAAVLGIIEGRGDGTFDPDAYITRAEAMTIVNRTLGRAPSAEHMLPDMITWPDNMDTTTWYYAAVQEATNSHDFELIEVDGTQVESWTVLQPVRDWAALERAWSQANSAPDPNGGEVMGNR